MRYLERLPWRRDDKREIVIPAGTQTREQSGQSRIKPSNSAGGLTSYGSDHIDPYRRAAGTSTASSRARTRVTPRSKGRPVSETAR
jgi:hypothetical protein